MSKTIDVDGQPKGWPPEGGGDGKGAFMKGGSKPPPIVMAAAGVLGVVLLLTILMAASGRLGVASIAPGQVGVKVNYLTGNEEIIETPGFQIYIPVISEVFIFDRTTQEYIMKGTKYVSDNHVPRLTVRARDGSNFWFDELRIQYEILPGSADIILNDSGPGDNYKEDWIKAHARSILRDEFGRFSAVQVADPTVYKAAPLDAARRMNLILEPHGVRVVRIITPNPKFDPAYETAIETRKEANQEVEELKARAEQLLQVREQKLAEVGKVKEVEMQVLKGTLVGQLRQAEADQIEVTRSADAFSTKRTAEGSAEKSQLVAQARGLEAKYRAEAEGLESKAKALEQRGEVVVREALIKKLASISFTLVPYSRDPVPKRLEHVGATGSATLVDETAREGN
ncbi:MAG: hypothetical protein ACI835_004599 [Planctomycetota bacterium]|jgi:hypothetical protein